MVKNNNSFLLMPSFYGLITFSIFYILYRVNFLNFYTPSATSQIIFTLVIACFGLSTLINRKRYNKLNFSGDKILIIPNKLKFILYVFYFIGYLGFIKYLFDMISALGGVVKFFLILQSESNLIRNTIEDIASGSIQMTYFGWFAMWLTFYLIRIKKLSPKWYYHIVITFILNLLFIDRTRPVWLLVVLLLIMLVTLNVKKINFFKFAGYGLSVAIFFVAMFNQIGNWVGKKNEDFKYGQTVLPTFLQNAVFYCTSSYGYFDQVLKTENISEFSPDRTAYPLAKLSKSLSFRDQDVVAQINDFYDIPYSTNVGTFLEPFYRDGSYLYLIFGIIFYSFAFDYIGYLLLKSMSVFNHILWANLVFVNIIGFFTPKIGSTSIWLFVFIAIIFAKFVNKRRIHIEIKS